MPRADSALNAHRIARCRALLAAPRRKDSIWPPLGAAALLAISALVFAAAMVVAPPLQTEHVVEGRAVR